MIAVAVVAIVFALPTWKPRLVVGFIWREAEPDCGRWFPSEWHHVLCTPILAPWVLSTVALATISANGHARRARITTGAVGVLLASWLLLSRPCCVSPGGVWLWPDDGRRILNQLYFGWGGVVWHVLWPRTVRQAAEFLCLGALLTLATMSLWRPVRRGVFVLATLAVNGYYLAEWLMLMWWRRDLGWRTPPWPEQLGGTTPGPSGAEMLQGALLIGVLAYLLTTMFRSRSARYRGVWPVHEGRSPERVDDSKVQA